MVIKDLRYVKLAFSVPYVIIFIWGLCIYWLYKTAHPAMLIIPVFLFMILFVRIMDMGKVIVKNELDRRMSKFTIPKVSIFSWNYGNSIGFSFIDPEKNTFWFCGEQTDYDIHIYPMEEINYSELSDRIVYRTENGLRYITYKYTI